MDQDPMDMAGECIKEFAESERQLRDALKQCVAVLRQWHGEEVFDIYYNHAPEMQAVREALPYEQAMGEN